MTMRTKAELAQLLEWIREELVFQKTTINEENTTLPTTTYQEIIKRINDTLEDPDC